MIGALVAGRMGKRPRERPLFYPQIAFHFRNLHHHIMITRKTCVKHCLALGDAATCRSRRKPMRRILNRFARRALIIVVLTTVTFTLLLPLQSQCPATPNIFQTTLLEKNQPATE